MENCNVAMYDDYPNGYPECEKYCIKVCKKFTNTIAIGSDYDPKPFREYAQDKLKVTADRLKPNHYADFLGSNLLDSLNDVYGIKLDRALKIDTDYLMYSRFILRDLFKLNKTIIGTDLGYLIHYGNPTPSRFLNMHLIYEVESDKINKTITPEIFNKYLDDYWKNNHYTATGPFMLNKEFKVPEFDLITPWCTDPSTFNTGIIKMPYRSGALGLHFQSSVFKSHGFEVKNISREGSDILISIEELL